MSIRRRQNNEYFKKKDFTVLTDEQLRHSIYVVAILALFLPPFVGGTLTGLMGFYPLPEFYFTFFNITGLYFLAVVVAIIILVPRYHRFIVSLTQMEQTKAEQLAKYYFSRLPWHIFAFITIYSIIGSFSVDVSLELMGYKTYTLRDHLYIQIGVFPVILLTAYPIFFYFVDRLGRYLGPHGIYVVAIPLWVKILILGVVTPLLIDSLLIGYYYNRTGYFQLETFILWLSLFALAVGSTWIAWRSFRQSINPLEAFIASHDTLIFDKAPTKLIPQSLDELGILTSQLNKLTHGLIETSSLQQAIFDNAAYTMITINTDGIITLINKAAERMLGYNADELVDKQTPAIFHLPEEVAARAEALSSDLGIRLEPGIDVLVIRAKMGLPNEHEWTLVRKDGSQFPSLLSASVLYDSEGEISGYLGIAIDISERKLAEERLRSVMALNNEVINSSPIGIAIYDETGHCIEANQSIADIIGATQEQALAQNYNEIESWKKSGLLDAAKKSIHTQKKERHEFDVVTTFGKHAFYDCSFTPFQLHHKQHLLLMVDDISDRKHTEQALKDNEKYLNFLLSNNPVTIYTCSTEPPFGAIYISSNVKQQMGYEPEQFTTNSEFWASNIHPDDRQQVFDNLPRLFEQGSHQHEYRFRLNDGRYRWMHDELRLIKDENGKIVEIIGYWADITERKHAENLQKKNQEQLNEAQRMAKMGSWTLDLRTNHLEWSDEIFRLFEIEKQSFGSSYEAFLDAIHPDDREMVDHAYTKSVENHQPYEIVHRLLFSDGRIKYVHEICETLYDNEGTPVLSRGTVQDITRQRETNEKLRQSQAVFENTAEGILITDTSLNIISINPAFTTITGYSLEEVVGKNPNILNSSAQEAEFYNNMWRTLNDGKIWHGSLVDKKKDGTYYPALMTIVPVIDEAGHPSHFVATQQDMTEYRRLEQQFHEAQKMEAMGTLVGGIAHDFNNMLGGIMGNVYFAKQRVGTNELLMQNIELIEQLSTRAADVVKQLLIFARKEQVEMSDFSLNALLEDGIVLTSSSIPDKIELETNFSSEQLFIKGNPTQIQQILMNLIINARDALEDIDNPKIICSLNFYYADDTFKQRHPETYSNKFALLSVRDNGKGIRKEIVDRIFDPFFTTKEVGKGTGLGLSMVYGAIKSHKGFIEVDSNAEKGTVFNIYLPLIKHDKGESSTTKYAYTKAKGELILLADDDKLLRVITKEALVGQGYQVMAASDGEEALTLYEKYKNDIMLVILDVDMPKISGVDAALRIRQLNNGVPVIFATGYDKNDALKSYQELDNSIVLNKPYPTEILFRSIKNLLETI